VGKRSFFLLFYQFFVVMVLVLAIATIFWPAKQVDVVVGAKGYTEQHVLAGLLSAELNRAGFKTEQKIGLGSQVIFEALRGNSIDVYFEYSGTVWAGHMSHEDNPGPEVIREAVERYVESQGVYFVGFGGFENRYALAMRRDRAEALGVTSITDLAGIGESMKAGGDLEFFGRLEWIRTNQIYGVDFDEKLIFDSSMMYGAVASGEVDVISAYTTDGRIAAYDLLILDDPNNAMLSYDAMLLSSDRITKRPRVMRVLARLANRLTDANMREANRMVDVDGLPVSTAVAFLQNTVNFDYKSD
jgi:osmoprotectant transport system permease protein